MKIGILTLPPANNYGGILQAFALQHTLKANGHQPTLINRREDAKSNSYYLKLNIKYFIHKLMGNKRNWPLSERAREEQEKTLCTYTNQFINKYIPSKTKAFNSSKGFESIGKFDAYIVGSDQVWRPKYTSNIYDYFFDFVKEENAKRISYAASFGTDEWEFTDEETAKCMQLVGMFDAVSVREDKGVDICKNHLNVAAIHVLDPTLLLNKEEYISHLQLSTEKKSVGNLMTYVLDKSKDNDSIIKAFAAKKEFVPFSISLANEDDKGNIIPTPPVEEWLQGFMNAEFIITDSFHGTAFSIIFNKPFIAIGNKNRGLSRFTSLLKAFDLEDRLVTNIEDINNILLSDIDWDKVNTKKEELKIKSLAFINKALE